MTRSLILLLLIEAAGCDEKSLPPAPAPASSDLAKRPLPAEVMRAMIGSGESCIQRFRPKMPPTYPVHVRVNRSRDGYLALEFQSGDRAEFNDCIVAAIRAAHIPVDLPKAVDMPLAFDFSGAG